MTFVMSLLDVALTAAPWLLLGLLAAGLIKALVDESYLTRWLGGNSLASVTRGAIFGVPLPLCSCGAIPTALTLHRQGAGRGPTTAFMIGTPGVGVDSLTITYALLGPFMLLARLCGTVVVAITTGIGVATKQPAPAAEPTSTPCCGGCCEGSGSTAASQPAKASLGARLRSGIQYAFTDVLDDISLWLGIGLLLAGVLTTLVPTTALSAYGSGLGAMLLMSVIGIPLYICATAATPIAAGLILAGVSPGTALVFLIAGPVTSIATLGIVRREFGTAVLMRYLAGILASAVVVGLAVDGVIHLFGVNVIAQVESIDELLPLWLEGTALIMLVVLAVKPLRRQLRNVAVSH
ncbi:SO_0444 family Cu/Zn efflux transporter [Halomonas vilamensis]|uniref:SO_0444 family Cu/Zn efflux transporter n=1 Tax=Vreelandella vilamensis TaxID=531309 RepID=A0ABU1H6K7_9GAMM|nr:SO_0444 family Cu/Zn efflux transporter [Halomonas vilamensis]MDR5899925.1 SO_0444 family Cu/Zn efflux transporter [Halomonas vilamensis]